MTRHKRISWLKSVARLVGCMGGATLGTANGLLWLCIWFAVGEVLGVFEEVGEP